MVGLAGIPRNKSDSEETIVKGSPKKCDANHVEEDERWGVLSNGLLSIFSHFHLLPFEQLVPGDHPSIQARQDRWEGGFVTGSPCLAHNLGLERGEIVYDWK